MTAEEVRAAWLDWLANERGVAPPIVEAYGRDVAELIVFVMMSQGRMPDEKTLTDLPPETLDGFIASRRDAGADEAAQTRLAASVRGFQRFLIRRRAKPAAET